MGGSILKYDNYDILYCLLFIYFYSLGYKFNWTLLLFLFKMMWIICLYRPC